MLNKDYRAIKEKIIDWLKQKKNESGTRGAVVGLSGGIDSAVTAVLCKNAFPENTLGVIMPCHSDSEDEQDALLLTEVFSIQHEIIELKKTYETMLASLPDEGNKIARGNIKSRLRMIILYFFANINNYLVVGTGNRSELKLGYFTKYGDGGVDIEPLGNLSTQDAVTAHSFVLKNRRHNAGFFLYSAIIPVYRYLAAKSIYFFPYLI